MFLALIVIFIIPSQLLLYELKNLFKVSLTSQYGTTLMGKSFVLLPANLKRKSSALYEHVTLIEPIKLKKSPFQSQVMLFYLMLDR